MSARKSITASSATKTAERSAIRSQPGITATKPGSATHPFPGVGADVLGESTGEPVAEGQGVLVLTRPWPSMLRTLYREPERFVTEGVAAFQGPDTLEL